MTLPFDSNVKNKMLSAAKYFFLAMIAIVSCYPFLWVVQTSFKTNDELYQSPFSLPTIFRVENYYEAWSTADVGRNFINSLLVCIVTMIILSVIASMAAYILARIFKSRVLKTYFSLGIMIPIHAILIPSVIVLKNLSLIDNLWGLIIIYTAVNLSLSIFLLIGFFSGIPYEMEEAATIDGSSGIGIFFKIILPISKPGLATAITLAFLNSWNDLLFGLVLISNPALKTLTMAISTLRGSYMTRYGILCSGFVISIIPVILIYILFQEQVIKGMTAGSVKG